MQRRLVRIRCGALEAELDVAQGKVPGAVHYQGRVLTGRQFEIEAGMERFKKWINSCIVIDKEHENGVFYKEKVFKLFPKP